MAEEEVNGEVKIADKVMGYAHAHYSPLPPPPLPEKLIVLKFSEVLESLAEV